MFAVPDCHFQHRTSMVSRKAKCYLYNSQLDAPDMMPPHSGCALPFIDSALRLKTSAGTTTKRSIRSTAQLALPALTLLFSVLQTAVYSRSD